MKQDNAKAIKSLLKKLHGLMSEENGWEPKTSRDYSILTWSAVKELREDIKPLRDDVNRLKGGFMLLGGGIVAIVAKLIFGA